MFHTFTGLTPSEFDKIYAQLEQQYPQYEQKRLTRKKRKRAIGAGRPYKLPLKERMVMLLMYYRLYITYGLLEYLLIWIKAMSTEILLYLNQCLKPAFRFQKR